MTSSLSRPARWRIATLVFVHVCIAVHIIHWKLAGTTLSSIQLSDAGRFAAEGVATASVFFFGLLLLVTLLFGRFFCSWGCHMLALQEICRLLLGRIGIRPKLIRSRVLMFVPLYAAFVIYFQPVLERVWFKQPFPTPALALESDQLWAGLPGPVDAVVILVGGLLMVYLLGSLSFCKYVCPYGALFRLADTAALGRIRLAGDCDGCGLCTAACTTGVRVHEEVQRFAMVANSGCMRCFECVSACPRRVLAYRLGRPALTAVNRAGLTRYAFSLGEELLVLGLLVISFFALHGLYDAVPLLISLIASVVVAYLGVVMMRVLLQPHVVLRGIALKRSRRLSRAGTAFVAGTAVLLLLLVQSVLIQYHQHRAAAALDALQFPRLQTAYSAIDRRIAMGAASDLHFCSRYGLIDSVDWNMKLAWVYRILKEPAAVERYLRRAIALDPTLAAAHFNLAKELARQGRSAEASQSFDEAVRLAPELAQHRPASS
jgi:4Fe-4S dicluster protein/4Fe-4S binding protein/tetratricopeptide repeat protein